MREQLFGTSESYLHRLLKQGEEALKSGRQQASSLREADELRSGLTKVLFEPFETTNLSGQEKSGEQIKQEAHTLLSLSEGNCGSLTKEFIATSRSLISKWEESLFNCYDVPLLPANNAALESRFNCLRSATRRISGRKKTNELRRTAHLQLLLYAETKEELILQFGKVEEEAYLKARLSLEAAEEPLRQLARLSRKPYETASLLAAEYVKLI